MDIKEIKEEYLRQKIKYEESVKRSTQLKEEISDILKAITSEQIDFCRENGIEIDKFISMDLDRLAIDKEYRDEYVELQQKIIERLHEYLEESLNA